MRIGKTVKSKKDGKKRKERKKLMQIILHVERRKKMEAGKVKKSGNKGKGQESEENCKGKGSERKEKQSEKKETKAQIHELSLTHTH